MKRVGYTIHCEVHFGSKNTIVLKTLNTNNEWRIATAQPARFPSAENARKHFFGPHGESIEPVGSCIWIRGPRGGYHAMRESRS